MITLDTLRVALAADKPWTELDRLVRAEQTQGRRVKEIQAELEALVEPIRDAVNLPGDADDALMDTLDALAGNCAPKWRYTDEPTEVPPTDPGPVTPADHVEPSAPGPRVSAIIGEHTGEAVP